MMSPVGRLAVAASSCCHLAEGLMVASPGCRNAWPEMSSHVLGLLTKPVLIRDWGEGARCVRPAGRNDQGRAAQSWHIWLASRPGRDAMAPAAQDPGSYPWCSPL